MVKTMIPPKRVVVKQIQDAIFVKSEGDFEPNYIVTRDAMKISRLELAGNIQGMNNYGFVFTDDTGSILVLVFDEKLKEHLFLDFCEGDFVQVVGKPNLGKNGNIVVIAEGFHKIPDKLVALHKLKVAKMIQEHQKKLRKALEIYNEYGVSRKAILLAQSNNIDPEILDAIDRLELEKEHENAIKELISED